MSLKHPVDRGRPGQRSAFDRLAEGASNFSSSPAFFALCALLVVGWATAHALHVDDQTLHILGEGMAALTLLLVALLKNAELRSERAIQAKLDSIAAAMLEGQGGTSTGARRDLEQAIGMHDEV